MSNAIKCDSCGGSNQLPEGKKSMFCAFCGNAIEKAVQQQKILKKFPKIITKGKIEIEFENYSAYNIKKTVYENSEYYALKNIEHYRTNDGYNLVVKGKMFNGLTFEKFKKTEFIPFEYDMSEYESKLNLESMGIISFEDLIQHYKLEEIDNLTELILDNNKIKDWEGVKNFNFQHLKKISLKNNEINSLPDRIKNEHTLKVIDLSNNKIEKINDIISIDVLSVRIILKGNPLNFIDFPNIMTTNLNNIKFKLSNIKNPQDRSNKMRHYLEFILNEEQPLIYEYVEPSKPRPRKSISETKKAEPKNQGKCFIATAALGSYNHPQVMELRYFRDEWILEKSWGESFLNWYYHYGAVAAKYIEKSFILKKFSYLLIVKPLVYLSRIVKK